MTHDADPFHIVMESFEGGMFELLEACRNESACLREHSTRAPTQSYIQAMGDQVPTTEALRVGDQLIERQADRSIVRGDDGAGAGADDDVNPDAVSHEPPQNAEVTGTTQSATAQHEPNADSRLRIEWLYGILAALHATSPRRISR
jgi:hypothetical protein